MARLLNPAALLVFASLAAMVNGAGGITTVHFPPLDIAVVNTIVPLPAEQSGMTAEIREGMFGSNSIELSGTGRSFRATRVR